MGLNRFFVPESNGEALLEDPFIQGLRPFLRQLDWEQWQSILKRLAAISDHVSTSGAMRTMPQPQPATGARIAAGTRSAAAVVTAAANAGANCAYSPLGSRDRAVLTARRLDESS